MYPQGCYPICQAAPAFSMSVWASLLPHSAGLVNVKETISSSADSW